GDGDSGVGAGGSGDGGQLGLVLPSASLSTIGSGGANGIAWVGASPISSNGTIGDTRERTGGAIGIFVLESTVVGGPGITPNDRGGATVRLEHPRALSRASDAHARLCREEEAWVGNGAILG